MMNLSILLKGKSRHLMRIEHSGIRPGLKASQTGVIEVSAIKFQSSCTNRDSRFEYYSILVLILHFKIQTDQFFDKVSAHSLNAW